MNSVLDSSALLAFLLSEPGGTRVATRLRAGTAMSSVNFSETVGYFARRGRKELDIRRILASAPVDVIVFDEALAYETGLMLPLTRSAGLSLGDRACLGLARRLGLTAVTADRQWQLVAAATGVNVDFIR